MNKIVRCNGQGGDTMVTMVLKLKKTNYLAILLMIIIVLWQGYGIYQGTMMGLNMDQYIYSKVIANVMPGAVLPKQPGEVGGFNKTFNFLTDIDITHYKTFIERNIPLIKYMALLSGHETSQGIMGSYYKTKEKSEKDRDYFAQDDELIVLPFEQNIVTDKLVSLEQLADDSYVLQKLVNFDANLNYENQAMNILNIPQLSQQKFKIDTKTDGPQVLILHTHSMERFAGEEPGSQGILDLGAYLKEILETQYGISALHCTSSFDVVDNRTERTGSYERMEPEISQIIKDNPSIQLVIDLHRDGIDNSTEKFLTNVNGESTAKIMFVNGFCQVQQNGILTPVTRLPNPYVEDNMALSLQLQLRANELYPGLMRKTLVKPYRYSLHMKPMSLLVEVGNQNNTKEEALNTMKALGEILMDVIEKD